MKHIAVIPARSGSKGVKDKNIRKLNGKPLLAYSIEAAKKAGIFDVIHVSTDSVEYADISVEYGAEVPFLRDEKLASDNATTWDTMRYVLKEYKKFGKEFGVITVLQPTSPLRTADDIVDAYRFFVQKQANMISSVCEMEHTPLWSNTLPQDLSMADFENEKVTYLPRQRLPIYYRETGAIYILKTQHLFSTNNIYKEKCYAYIMDVSHSIDIDSELDFSIAEMIKKNCKKGVELY